MQAYLESARKSLDDLSAYQHVHVVIGNEACDLDSAVSALTYAFYLSQTNRDEHSLVLPVLNIPRAQYRTRTETVHFLNRVNVRQENLVFSDEIDLQQLAGGGSGGGTGGVVKDSAGTGGGARLRLSLVDHNVLSGHQTGLEECVVGVLDHHVRERPDREGVTVKLDTVGSCCTLVAEELLKDPDFTVDETVAQLLYGTILIDTVNRLPEAGKITPRDEEVLGQLQVIVPDVDGDKLYSEIQAAKLDMTGLSNMDILEKDLKMVSGTGMVIAMSSVTMEIQTLLERPGFEADLETFCRSKMADVTVVMTMSSDDEGKPVRHIAVFSTNRIYRDQISDALKSATEVNLELRPLTPLFDNVTVCHQGNAQASRKKVMPILKSFLNKK